MIETNTIIEALYYILAKIKSADKIKLVKLIYLADKYHLIHYGRTLTDDDYYAMEFGPVGSTVKDILEFNSFTLSKNEIKYASQLLEKVNENTFRVNTSSGEVELDMLSETDIEALDFAIKNFGSMSPWELSDYTHKFPEWYKHEDLFENKSVKRKRIRPEELLSMVDDEYFKVSSEHLEESRNILAGKYD
ncbi:MAG: SocA family protein [Nitrospinae bacterium]|nr:SocA family protein [Nitrospinota bacterium]